MGRYAAWRHRYAGCGQAPLEDRYGVMPACLNMSPAGSKGFKLMGARGSKSFHPQVS